MKYFTSGAILFILYIGSLELVPRLVPSFMYAPVPSWWILSQVLIAVLFLFFGIQTARLEKKNIAGVAFILLAVVTLMIMSTFVGLSGLKG